MLFSVICSILFLLLGRTSQLPDRLLYMGGPICRRQRINLLMDVADELMDVLLQAIGHGTYVIGCAVPGHKYTCLVHGPTCHGPTIRIYAGRCLFSGLGSDCCRKVHTQTTGLLCLLHGSATTYQLVRPF
jgi:hypothetical protein